MTGLVDVEMTGLAVEMTSTDQGKQTIVVAIHPHLSDDEAVAKMGHPVLW
jgi:hypothetical protein